MCVCGVDSQVFLDRGSRVYFLLPSVRLCLGGTPTLPVHADIYVCVCVYGSESFGEMWSSQFLVFSKALFNIAPLLFLHSLICVCVFVCLVCLVIRTATCLAFPVCPLYMLPSDF